MAQKNHLHLRRAVLSSNISAYVSAVPATDRGDREHYIKAKPFDKLKGKKQKPPDV